VEQINNRVRDNVARQQLADNLAAAKAKAEDLTKKIKQLDAERVELIASAKFPVPGLGFSDDGVPTYQGIPLEQASGAQKIRVGMAVALAMNPKLKIVLVRDASLLDSDNMAIIAEMAEAAGAQVWLERVGTADAGAVIIEDGEVAQ
jgi:ABC-type glutathione transport system ATPase component